MLTVVMFAVPTLPGLTSFKTFCVIFCQAVSKAGALWGWPFTPFRLWEDNFIRIHEPSRFGTRLACWLSRWHQTWFVWWKSGAPCVLFWWSRVWRDWIHWIHPGAILPNIELEVTRVQSSTTGFHFFPGLWNSKKQMNDIEGTCCICI